MGKKQKFHDDLLHLCIDKEDMEVINIFSDWMISIAEDWNCDFRMDDQEAEALIKKIKSFRKTMKKISER